MSSLAKVIILGILAEDPVIREMEDRQKMVGLSIFTWRERHGAKGHHLPQEKEWHRVVIVNQTLAAYAEAHLARNDHVYLEGELHTRFWQSDTYETQSLTEIFLELDGDKLIRLANEGTCEQSASAGSMLDVASRAHLKKAPFRENKLGQSIPQ